MNWRILVIGKPKLRYAAQGVEEYLGRIQHFTGAELITVKTEADLLTRSAGTFRIVLDERGKLITSRDLAALMEKWELRAIRTVSLLIGGADGHSPALRDQANYLWSLSPLTMQHELALVVLLEQLYRAHSIESGLPYHRDGRG